MNRFFSAAPLIVTIACLASCGWSSRPAARSPGSLPSTEFGRTAWMDYALCEDAPGTDFYVGCWTRAVEPAGDGTGENDYPFVLRCSETVSALQQLIYTISGNIGFDPGYGPGGAFVYNQNITSNTGDYSGIYVFPGVYPSYGQGRPDEGDLRGWVYVAWHFRRTPLGTAVNQYVKFGPDGEVIKNDEDVIDGTGGFSGSPPPPAPEYATPLAICLGGDGYRAWSVMEMQYAKAYVMANPPTPAEVDAIALRTEPDSSAWADWPLIGGGMEDVSGNGRHLAVQGTAHAGSAGPDLRN